MSSRSTTTRIDPGAAVVPVRPSAIPTTNAAGDGGAGDVPPLTQADAEPQPGDAQAGGSDTGAGSGSANGQDAGSGSGSSGSSGSGNVPGTSAGVSLTRKPTSTRPVQGASGTASKSVSVLPTSVSASSQSQSQSQPSTTPLILTAGIAGGVVLLLIIAVSIFFCVRKRNRRRMDTEMSMGFERSNRYVANPNSVERGRRNYYEMDSPVNASHGGHHSRSRSDHRNGDRMNASATDRTNRHLGAADRDHRGYTSERGDAASPRYGKDESRRAGHGALSPENRSGNTRNGDRGLQASRNGGRGDSRDRYARSDNARDRRRPESAASVSSREESPDRGYNKRERRNHNHSHNQRRYGGSRDSY
ncbi:hypothetical protein HDU78_009900 [Chytriomyces hyalinus]|nr:hypothetical protein HDU78_009900 [Chytriomyces hyalinus]